MKIFDGIGQWKSSEGVSRENSYNLIRLLAASFVIYGHMYILNGDGAGNWLAIPVHTLGFKMLMIISGYMITQSCVRDGNPGRYWIKRACRLLPGLIACIVLSAYVLGPLLTTLPFGEYMTHPATRHYLKNILLAPIYYLPGVFETNIYPVAVNGSLWALPVEVSLYAVIWLVLFVGSPIRYRRALFTGITLCVCVLQLMHIAFFPERIYIFWESEWYSAFGMYPYFFLGAAFYLLPVRKYCNTTVAAVFLIIGAVLRFRSAVGYELLSYLFLPYAVISFGEQKSALSSKMPDITDGIFLWGFPVQQTFLYLCGRAGLQLSSNLCFVICMAIVTVAGILSAQTIEKWGMQLGKFLTKKKSA
ncbi:MAG: acyltransferase [Lachnospiraceae bacterium]|nr:acyltransferase [Lachnospiraceae bacterium]